MTGTFNVDTHTLLPPVSDVQTLAEENLDFRPVMRAKLDRLAGVRRNLDTQEVARWIEMLAQEDGRCAHAVVDRLDQILDRVDAGGFSRWIIHAQRLYPRDLARLRRYFSLVDAKAVEALHGEAAAADLASSLVALGHLMVGFSGRGVTLQAMAQKVLNAVPARPVLTPTHLLLPDSYTLLDGANRFGLFRAAVAHAAAHLRFSEPGRSVATLKPMSVAVVSALEDARVELLLAREMPGVKSWFLSFLGPVPDRSDLSFSAHMARLNHALLDERYQDDGFWVNKARAMFTQACQAHGLEDYDAFRRAASILANDLGQMRVPFNPQMYSVPTPYRDDNAYLWDFGEIKGKPPEGHELQVEPPLQASVPPPSPSDQPQEPTERKAVEEVVTTYTLPEWDYRLQLHRQDWCTLLEKRPQRGWGSRQGRGASGQAERPRLELPVTRRLSRARRLRRQWEGDDIDLNAAVEVMVSQRSDLSPEPRLFIRPGRAQPTSSVILLLDLSESANDVLPDGQQTILDVEKEAALSLAVAIAGARDKLAIHGFCSDSRSQVNYIRLLDVGQPLDEHAMAVVAGAQAAFSTRMGAAIRHATHLLADDPADQRAVIVITDGAPSDVDVHDDRYLVEDARDAVNAAQEQSVQCLCLAMDKHADRYVRDIFGWRNYQVIDRPELMSRRLRSLYGRFLMA